jgi:hypothetical protein
MKVPTRTGSPLVAIWDRSFTMETCPLEMFTNLRLLKFLHLARVHLH